MIDFIIIWFIRVDTWFGLFQKILGALKKEQLSREREMIGKE